ncbi:LysR family transcriptional regulator [Zobellella endophytica]|uniref:LysR family transcriptional regulator n=1 Tax=Zobellella endophytica TaxID=2116700 RepID=A0A2P7R1B0_9GAMM|nr:LysR substrate-binding domain-containing protein [Zobellella endophytica]PSJ44002.1 LysR family transcriptional regulator [Zobellella endophytica]
MNFTLKQLRLFVAVAEHGSLSRAADTLAITQSAATMSLQELERQLNHPLFDRVGRRLRLNAWGLWLLPRAQKMLAESDQIELGFQGKSPIAGRLRLGASRTIADCWIPELIELGARRYPQLDIGLAVDNTHSLLQQLYQGRLEMALIEAHAQEKWLRLDPWCRDELVIVCQPAHPLAREPEVGLAQLEACEWILRESGSGTRDTFEQALQGRLGPLKIRQEYPHLPTIKRLLQSRPWLSCVSRLSVAEELAAGTLVALPVPELSLSRFFYFAWHKDRGDHPARMALIELARELLE